MILALPRRDHCPRLTLLVATGGALSYLSAGTGERPSSHPAIKAQGADHHGQLFRQRTSKSTAQNGRDWLVLVPDLVR